MTTNAKFKESLSGSYKKAKKRRRDPRDLVVLHGTDATGGGAIVKVLVGDDDHKPAKSTKRKPQRRRNPATPKKTAKKTANDVMLDAWEYTYKTRNRRLTNS